MFSCEYLYLLMKLAQNLFTFLKKVWVFFSALLHMPPFKSHSRFVFQFCHGLEVGKKLEPWLLICFFPHLAHNMILRVFILRLVGLI